MDYYLIFIFRVVKMKKEMNEFWTCFATLTIAISTNIKKGRRSRSRNNIKVNIYINTHIMLLSYTLHYLYSIFLLLLLIINTLTCTPLIFHNILKCYTFYVRWFVVVWLLIHHINTIKINTRDVLYALCLANRDVVQGTRNNKPKSPIKYGV